MANPWLLIFMGLCAGGLLGCMIGHINGRISAYREIQRLTDGVDPR